MNIGFTSNSAEFQREIEAEIREGELAVTRTMREASNDLKNVWRAEVRRGGLGNRLANTIRSAVYPTSQPSLNAAGTVWTNAPKIISSHNEGSLIRSDSGFWLAIPTEAAGKGKGRRRITPLEWERQRGLPLRFVYRGGGRALLVADDARINTKGQARRKGGRRRKDGILTGAQTVVIFILVAQVKLRKRFDLGRDADRVAGTIAARLAANWK